MTLSDETTKHPTFSPVLQWTSRLLSNGVFATYNAVNGLSILLVFIFISVFWLWLHIMRIVQAVFILLGWHVSLKFSYDLLDRRCLLAAYNQPWSGKLTLPGRLFSQHLGLVLKDLTMISWRRSGPDLAPRLRSWPLTLHLRLPRPSSPDTLRLRRILLTNSSMLSRLLADSWFSPAPASARKAAFPTIGRNKSVSKYL